MNCTRSLLITILFTCISSTAFAGLDPQCAAEALIETMVSAEDASSIVIYHVEDKTELSEAFLAGTRTNLFRMEVYKQGKYYREGTCVLRAQLSDDIEENKIVPRNYYLQCSGVNVHSSRKYERRQYTRASGNNADKLLLCFYKQK